MNLRSIIAPPVRGIADRRSALFLVALLASGCVFPNRSPTNVAPLNTPTSVEVASNVGDETESEVPPLIQPVAFHADIADGMTLEELESLALQHSPAIQQASALARQASGIRTQVGLKPNPTLGYFGEEIGDDSAAGLHGAFVSQTFVRGNKLGWNRAVLAQDVQRSRWLAESQRYRVRNDIRVLFYEALGAQRRLELARQFRLEAKEGLEISKARVEAQEAARPDILQSEVQLSEVDLSIQRAEFEFMAAWNQLTAIAGVPELAPTGLLGEFHLPNTHRDLDSAFAQIVASSPPLAAACAQVRRAQANLQRQRVQPIPNLTAQVGAGYDDATGDEFANVQLSLPIPVHNRNQGNINAAYAEYCAATQNVQRIKMQLRSRLAEQFQAFQIAQATVVQYESLILPRVSETLELMQEAQRAGEFDFLRVFTARRAFFDANLKYVAAQTDLCKANTVIDGLLLTGALAPLTNVAVDDDLRGSALSGQ